MFLVEKNIMRRMLECSDSAEYGSFALAYQSKSHLRHDTQYGSSPTSRPVPVSDLRSIGDDGDNERDVLPHGRR